MYNSELAAIDYCFNESSLEIWHDKWRIKEFIEFINNEMRITNKMSEQGLSLNRLIDFYYYGNTIRVKIYDYNDTKGKYVEIVYENKIIIYELIEDSKLKSIYSVFGIS